MKYLVTFVVILAAWGAFSQYERSRINRQIIAEANANSEVILYATDWCGYCRATRKFLEDEKIAFVEFDIEKSDEGAKQYKARSPIRSVQPWVMILQNKLRKLLPTPVRKKAL